MRNGALMVDHPRQPKGRTATRHLEKYSEQEQQMIARGILTRPRKKKPVCLPKLVGNVPDGVMERIWQEERENRYSCDGILGCRSFGR